MDSRLWQLCLQVHIAPVPLSSSLTFTSGTGVWRAFWVLHVLFDFFHLYCLRETLIHLPASLFWTSATRPSCFFFFLKNHFSFPAVRSKCAARRAARWRYSNIGPPFQYGSVEKSSFSGWQVHGGLEAGPPAMSRNGAGAACSTVTDCAFRSPGADELGSGALSIARKEWPEVVLTCPQTLHGSRQFCRQEVRRQRQADCASWERDSLSVSMTRSESEYSVTTRGAPWKKL